MPLKFNSKDVRNSLIGLQYNRHLLCETVANNEISLSAAFHVLPSKMLTTTTQIAHGQDWSPREYLRVIRETRC
jgi:hypothetical protein